MFIVHEFSYWVSSGGWKYECMRNATKKAKHQIITHYISKRRHPRRARNVQKRTTILNLLQIAKWQISHTFSIGVRAVCFCLFLVLFDDGVFLSWQGKTRNKRLPTSKIIILGIPLYSLPSAAASHALRPFGHCCYMYMRSFLMCAAIMLCPMLFSFFSLPKMSRGVTTNSAFLMQSFIT